MPDPTVVIIIPSQGNDLNAFEDSADALNKKVYGGKATIVKTTVTPTAGSHTVVFKTKDGKAFDFAGKKGIKRVLTISHSFSGDGPNLAYHAGGYQPWGSDGTGEVLSADGKSFWKGVGDAMPKDGQIILLGCYMGKHKYGTLVADASGKPVYAASDLFAAGNSDTAVKYVKAIEGGRTPAPMKKFGPPVPAAAPAPAAP
jgi:hypothetical protein